MMLNQLRWSVRLYGIECLVMTTDKRWNAFTDESKTMRSTSIAQKIICRWFYSSEQMLMQHTVWSNTEYYSEYTSDYGSPHHEKIFASCLLTPQVRRTATKFSSGVALYKQKSIWFKTSWSGWWWHRSPTLGRSPPRSRRSHRGGWASCQSPSPSPMGRSASSWGTRSPIPEENHHKPTCQTLHGDQLKFDIVMHELRVRYSCLHRILKNRNETDIWFSAVLQKHVAPLWE